MHFRSCANVVAAHLLGEYLICSCGITIVLDAHCTSFAAKTVAVVCVQAVQSMCCISFYMCSVGVMLRVQGKGKVQKVKGAFDAYSVKVVTK